MKSLIAAAIAALALTGTTAPIASADIAFDTVPAFDLMIGNTEFDRRGRGGRSKPRVPGGSGCDDPRDIIEHPECAVVAR